MVQFTHALQFVARYQEISMANYIQNLQTIVDERGERLMRLHERIEWMRAHLLSSKFQGLDVEGARKDWIATADVLRFIEELRTI